MQLAARARVGQMEPITGTLRGLRELPLPRQVQLKVRAPVSGAVRDGLPRGSLGHRSRRSLAGAPFYCTVCCFGFGGKAGQALWSTISGLAIYSVGNCGEVWNSLGLVLASQFLSAEGVH